MQNFELLEKGKTGIKLTTNNTNGNSVKVYKITEDADGNVIIEDITEDSPTIDSIAGDVLKQYTFDAPNEDCYLLTLFNGYPRFFRVGTPTIRYFLYNGKTKLTIGYKLTDFAGETISEGNMDEADFGVYHVTPTDTGDQILIIDNYGIKAVHTPYIVDGSSFSGKIIFQKDQWMLLAIPKENTKISDVVKDIEDKYDVEGKDLFTIFSAYPSTASQSKEMLDYSPNYTPEDVKYNFSLIYEDGNAKEIAGFWVKTKNYNLEDLGAGDADELVEYEWHQ